MLFAAIALFAVAALAGASMAIGHFRGNTPPPVGAAILHGLFAASGLVVLLLAVINVGGASRWAAGLFLAAALGGFVLLSFHLRGKALPGGLVVGHGLLAIAGFVVLLSAVLVTA
jgi:hypothetical protein